VAQVGPRRAVLLDEGALGLGRTERAPRGLVERAQVQRRQLAAVQPERVHPAHDARRERDQRHRLREPQPLPVQRAAEDGVDQHQADDAPRVAAREVQRHLSTKAVADEDGRRAAFGVEHRGEVVAPPVHADAPARDRAAVAAQVDADQRVARGERRLLDELGEAAAVARQAVD
jgi:hypothetical protein